MIADRGRKTEVSPLTASVVAGTAEHRFSTVPHYGELKDGYRISPDLRKFRVSSAFRGEALRSRAQRNRSTCCHQLSPWAAATASIQREVRAVPAMRAKDQLPAASRSAGEQALRQVQSATVKN